MNESRRWLRKLVGLPEEYEPDPNAIKKLSGCISYLVDEKIDVTELMRELEEVSKQ